MDEKEALKSIVEDIHKMLGVRTEAHYSRIPPLCICATISEQDTRIAGFIPSRGCDIVRVVIQLPFLPIRERPCVVFFIPHFRYDHIRKSVLGIILKHAPGMEVAENHDHR